MIADPHTRAPEPLGARRDDPGMANLHASPVGRLLAGTLALAVGFAPLASAAAASPDTPNEIDSVRFAAPPPEPDQDQPLRIATEAQHEAQHEAQPEAQPAPEPIVVVEPPPEPIALAVAPAPIYTPEPTPASPLRVDGRRPKPGTGLIALGALGLGMSAAMQLTALAGPGWGELERRDAAILAGLSLPVALASSGMLIGGTKAHRKYERWADRNGVHPPKPGNGMILVGSAVSVVGIGTMGLTIQHAVTDPTPTRGNWAAVGVTGLLVGVGIALTTGGMVTRSKFAAWERSGYLSPGPLALERGGGLSLSGRF